VEFEFVQKMSLKVELKKQEWDYYRFKKGIIGETLTILFHALCEKMKPRDHSSA
jgi:hypothetical protein